MGGVASGLCSWSMWLTLRLLAVSVPSPQRSGKGKASKGAIESDGHSFASVARRSGLSGQQVAALLVVDAAKMSKLQSAAPHQTQDCLQSWLCSISVRRAACSNVKF